jgi:ParB family transcriptional regulator, chromosome partitioning protein
LWCSTKAGLANVSAFISDVSDDAALVFGLIENIQRKELNAIEEAKSIERLVNKFTLTHEQVAQAIFLLKVNILPLRKYTVLIQKVVRNRIKSHGYASWSIKTKNCY